MRLPFPFPSLLRALTFLRSRRRAAFGLATLALGAADIRAQAIGYVGDILVPADSDFVLPLNGRNTGESGTWVMSVSTLYKWNGTTNALDVFTPQFSGTFKINSFSHAAFGRSDGDSDSVLRVLGVQNTLYTYTTSDQLFTFKRTSVALGSQTMISYGSATTMVLSTNYSTSTDRFRVFSPATGAIADMGIGQVTNVGGTAFGTDGRLYVLDNPNGTYRVQSFDLSDGLADADRLKSSFTIAASLTSGYAGMAINSSGHLFIADGLGGGTAYDLAGNHLGDFSFTGGGSTTARGGASYLNVDDAGNIFVYTPDTGLHHYFDASYSAIPEPASIATALAFAGLGAALWRRRRTT